MAKNNDKRAERMARSNRNVNRAITVLMAGVIAEKVDALCARRAVALMHRLFLRRVVDPDSQGLPAGHDDDVRDRAGRDAHRHRVPALSA